MSRTWVVSVLVVVALIIPTMTFSQAVPIGAWCGGSYGAEGTNFGPCPTVQSGAQVAGPASGIQAQRGPTEPQYPASQVAFEDGRAFFNKEPLNLGYTRFADRTDDIQSGD